MTNKSVFEALEGNEQEMIDYKNIALSIGSAHVYGPIEDFTITLYSRTGTTYKFQVVGGNICSCNNEDMAQQLEYEVH